MRNLILTHNISTEAVGGVLSLYVVCSLWGLFLAIKFCDRFSLLSSLSRSGRVHLFRLYIHTCDLCEHLQQEWQDLREALYSLEKSIVVFLCVNEKIVITIRVLACYPLHSCCFLYRSDFIFCRADLISWYVVLTFLSFPFSTSAYANLKLLLVFQSFYSYCRTNSLSTDLYNMWN